jgi:hypothetical protein
LYSIFFPIEEMICIFITCLVQINAFLYDQYDWKKNCMPRPIWKCPCIKLFITYFRHLEKRHPYWPETKSRPIWKWSCSNPITGYYPGVWTYGQFFIINMRYYFVHSNMCCCWEHYIISANRLSKIRQVFFILTSNFDTF